jgi:hypothetical protein
MTTTAARKANLTIVRKRVRSIGVVKGVWRLNIFELRRHAFRLLTDRPDWLTPQDKKALTSFVLEDDDYCEFFCDDCGRVCPAGTCNNWRCELCCDRLCESD